MLSGNLPLIPTVLPIAIFALIYKFIIIPYLFDPLSEIPNAHWSSPISRLWILHKRLIQRDTPTVHEAHQKLGPVIRLGPKEISVNSVEGGIRSVYSGGYEKGDWYSNVFANYGVKPMFAMEEHGMHSKRKRMISNIYAKSTLQQSKQLKAASRILLKERVLPKLDRLAETGQPFEWYELVSAITMDFVNSYIFGLRSGSDFLRKPDQCAEFLKSYKLRQNFTFWPQELPLLTRVLKTFGLGSLVVPNWVGEANAGIEDWILEMCDAAEKTLNSVEADGGDGEDEEDYPTVYAQLQGAMLKEQAKAGSESLDASIAETIRKQRLEIASELLDHSMAGFDTSGITLTYLAWELSRPENKQWQDRLRAEISSISTSGNDDGSGDVLPSPKAIDSLPLLQAILMETLRLHAAIPGNQPRVTPANAVLGGAPRHYTSSEKSEQERTQVFANLPANTRVNAQAWSLHRNPEVFPDPERWNPARWLLAGSDNGEGVAGESSEEQLREMGRWFWAFGSGGRMCVGSNLAMQEMKAVVSLVWGPFGFHTRVVDGWGDMAHNGGYLAEPVGSADGKVLGLTLEKVGRGHGRI